MKPRITPKNLVRHELIGLRVKVVNSTHPQLIGLEGEVIDETKNMLMIKTPKGRKLVQKAICTFQFKLPDGRLVNVNGRLIVGRPEDRLKKRVR